VNPYQTGSKTASAPPIKLFVELKPKKIAPLVKWSRAKRGLYMAPPLFSSSNTMHVSPVHVCHGHAYPSRALLRPCGRAYINDSALFLDLIGWDLLFGERTVQYSACIAVSAFAAAGNCGRRPIYGIVEQRCGIEFVR
jgi:hypothetical protein